MVIALLSYLVTVAVSLAIVLNIHKWRKVFVDDGYLPTYDVIISFVPAFNLAHALSERDFCEPLRRSRIELVSANKLSVCRSCGRFSRQYQRHLAEMRHRLAGEKYSAYTTCPHCGKDKIGLSVEQYEWQAKHPDCPAIDKAGLYDYLKTVADAEKALKDIESIEAFRKYNKF